MTGKGIAKGWRVLCAMSLIGLVANAGCSRSVEEERLAATSSAALASMGTDFWLMFTQNYYAAAELTLYVSSDVAATGLVEIPGMSFAAPFSITPGTVAAVTIPGTAQVSTSDVVEWKGIHVTAGAPVSVYGMNRLVATTDAFLGLPSDILGGEYIVLSYPGLMGSQFGLVATQEGTTVTITPSAAVGARPAGVPYTVGLNAGQTYQLWTGPYTSTDLSGTVVTADRPIAVFGSNRCANIPSSAYACDYIVEELPPTTAWGTRFVTMPLATRLNGDTFRFIAANNGTVLTINGATATTLARGAVYETILRGPSSIEASAPILVAQFSNGSTYDGVTSDPFMMLIPPYEQFLNRYTVATPSTGFANNFVNLVAPAAGIGAITLDGAAVPAGSFQPIGTTGFHGAQIAVSRGTHDLAGTLPFGVTVYGFDAYDSYGYPGGMSLAPIAIVTGVSVMPSTASAAVGETTCLTATVTDQYGQPVPGVRVDFLVEGANAAAGFAQAAADGTATYCYGGANEGSDTVTASVGAISGEAAVSWAPPGYSLTMAFKGTATGTVTGTAGGAPIVWGGCGPDPLDAAGTSCTARIPIGAPVSLTATAAAGAKFMGWGVVCTGTNGCNFTMNSAKIVWATFNPAQYEVGVAVAGAGVGRVVSSPAGIVCGAGDSACSALFANGDSVTLTASYDATRYVFTGWSGGCLGTSATCTVLMNDAKMVTASFGPATYALGVSVMGQGSGTVSGPGVSCSTGSTTGCTANEPKGSTVALTASPAAGSVFKGWSGCSTMSGTTCYVTMNMARSVSATFEPATYALTVSFGGTGRGMVTVNATINGATMTQTCNGSCAPLAVPNGAAMSLTATGTNGATFQGWGIVCIGTGTCSFKMNAPKTVLAKFAAAP